MSKHQFRAIFSLLLIVALLSATPAFSLPVDEGMYTLDKVSSLPLKQRGLKIPVEKVTELGKGSLADAVIRLSIGCTAEFVSPEGLILTNHHCGFDALVSASSPGKDLVEDGFKANNRSEEIPAKDYSIFITERMEDVTAKITAGTENLPESQRMAAISSKIQELVRSEQAKAPAGSTVVVSTMSSGYYYYLIQTRRIDDIRVVYAPPRSIGVFGGDPDNFEWTRHTGDFTFLRAYVAPDGSSAPYSAQNVPYKPKKFLTLNIGGINEGDFVFVLGYPGATTRYRESQSIAFARDYNFPFLAEWLKKRSDALKEIGSQNEAKRIEFQSDIAAFDNAFKVYDGGGLRLRKSKVVEARQSEEQKLQQWIDASPERKQKYGSLLSDIAAVYSEINTHPELDILLRRIPDQSTLMLSLIYSAVTSGKMLSDSERQAKEAEFANALKNQEPEYEYQMIKFFLRKFAELPEGQKFEGAENLFGKLKGKERIEAEDKFAKNIAMGDYWNARTLAAQYGPMTMEYRPERDDVRGFVMALQKAKQQADARNAQFAAKIVPLRLKYMRALSEMRGLQPYPDANSTLRFTFGNIKGYSPREAEVRYPFTTMKGMLEKDTGVNPFDMPQKLKDLQASKDFGRYGSGDSVVVNFLATTDIIGGNSGSPIFNGKGEQIGIIFDGNYEGLGNDFYFDPDKNRSIAVDIRFVLFVVEKFANAKWIIDEMNIVGG
jgi:hypothetical protein